MLVLTRKQQQSLIIGGEIVLTVNRIHGTRVELGISAPRKVPVRRKELCEPVKAKAAQNGGPS